LSYKYCRCAAPITRNPGTCNLKLEILLLRRLEDTESNAWNLKLETWNFGDPDPPLAGREALKPETWNPKQEIHYLCP